MSDSIREPAVAGQFYPGDPGRLRAMIEECVPDSITKKVRGEPRALIVPHAGYQFSGRTAGEAYALLRSRTDVKRAVVLSPSHRVPFSGVSTGGYEAFRTPLGDIAVDTAACRELQSASRSISGRDDAHRYEHALEVQLPFLQHVLGEFELVPAVCGQMSDADSGNVARVLVEHLWRPDTVWIVSSDFTHYGASFGYTPFHNRVSERLRDLDQGAIEYICDLDPEGFGCYVADTGATICGAAPISVLLYALREVDEIVRCEQIKYSTSGDLTGDYRQTVSYASIAVTTEEGSRGEEENVEFELSEADKADLLKLARESIRTGLTGAEPPAVDEPELSPALRTEACAFVTLHIDGRLRGCIGSLEPHEPLYRNVIGNARNAAFRDPRFQRLTPEEFSKLDIEISVLTPARPIAGPEEFVVGKHGIILQKGVCRSVFLPQVAPEQGWDRETTLTHLALKAGLGPDDWRRDTDFQVFEAIVFSES